MVSKNSRMGNLVGNGVYHLKNPFKVTERVWREAKSWEYANVNTFSDWKFRLRILDYLSKNPAFSGNVSFGKTKIDYHLHSNRNFRFFVVNGEQPITRIPFRYSE